MENKHILRNVASNSLLADRAYEEIRVAIFANELPSGTSLSVPELARQLNVSRGPVREAVQRLVHDGLATYAPYRGAVVASMSVEDLRKLYDVRELLEGLAARLATKNLSEGSLVQLANVLEEHQKVLDEEKGLTAHVEMDMKFHRLVRELTNNVHLNQVLENLQGKVHLSVYSLWGRREAQQLALEDHRKIFKAMSEKNPTAAEAAARAHITRLCATLTERTEQEEQATEGF